jgi:hypothetical protein
MQFTIDKNNILYNKMAVRDFFAIILIFTEGFKFLRVEVAIRSQFGLG